jgi:hypothetical protein
LKARSKNFYFSALSRQRRFNGSPSPFFDAVFQGLFAGGFPPSSQKNPTTEGGILKYNIA